MSIITQELTYVRHTGIIQEISVGIPTQNNSTTAGIFEELNTISSLSSLPLYNCTGLDYKIKVIQIKSIPAF